ncbi:MAG: 2-phosphosulfolactate phosphatase [Bacteroidales bacterium]|nr:2-phosphosulfolactate phosphatase [Bacteroidales bacterium]
MNPLKLEVCFSPIQFPLFQTDDKIVVVVDILRATTVITTMFINGVNKVIPVKTIEEAKELKKTGLLVVAERDGQKLDFADFGNSPFYFTKEVVENKTLVYSTTNGTNALTLGLNSNKVIVGSFLNISSIVEYLNKSLTDVIILCAGWKDRFSLEDCLFAGALTKKLLEAGCFYTKCDSANASVDLWEKAQENLDAYLEKVAQKHRLQKLGLHNVIPYCFEHDKTNLIPYLCLEKDKLKENLPYLIV